MKKPIASKSALIAANQALQRRLDEAADMLRAIRSGEADALLIESDAGAKVYTIQGYEAEANRFRSEVLEQVTDAMIAIDGENRVIYLNAAAERLYDSPQSWALGRLISDLHGFDWGIPAGVAAAVISSAEPCGERRECRLVSRGGVELTVEMHVTALRNAGSNTVGRLIVITDITARRQQAAKLMVSEIRYRRLFEAAHDGVLILDPASRKIIDANPFMTKLLGYSKDELIGRELFEIGLLADEAASQKMFQELQISHEVRYENLPLVTHAGQHQDVEVVANLYDENGRPVIQCNIRDITERKRGEEHVRLLMAEVNHRARNLLAVVQSLAHQSAKYGDPATFTARLSGRIDGLSRGQDLLVTNQWLGIEIEDLVAAQLSHFKDLIGTRLLISGPRGWTLNMAAAQGIGMAIHELATNAAKYGALSNLCGQVRISWQVTTGANPTLAICWRESGGPKVTPPSRQGFGCIVIGRMAQAAVDGHAEISFAPDGLAWTLSAPLENALAVGKTGLLMRPQDAA